MMASHRPADSPPPAPPDTAHPEPAQTAGPAGLTTLPHSNFLVGFDWVLAFGVQALAFLLASFAVKNSDFWMHLASGRLLAEGHYEFGKDPFSYSGGDRTWVNHSWLYDGLLFLLFKAGEGPAVVIAKAVALAVTAGLLLLARKPGQSVFPGVVCVGLALVAAAPRLWLQPTVATFLFLATLMFLLFRVPRRPGSWVFPGLVAGLFCLWANFDQWFLLGPAVLLLYAVGQYVRMDEGEDIPTLWKALGIGVLATLINPHHVRVWVPPAEFVDGRLADALGKDPEFAGLFRGALTPGSLDFTGDRDNPANVYALVILVALGVIGFVVNRRRASAGLALVWAGAVALVLVHLRAIPFLAFVAAPVAAVNLAAAGRRLADKPLPDGTIRTLHALRGGGRSAVGLVGLLLIALTYPGWLHPFAQQRRWKWDVEPNPSLERAARKVYEWRTTGALPPEARLLNLQPDFASYLAWYAPGERSFFDDRLAFHRDEAGEYAALRRYLSTTDPRKRRQDPFDLNEFLTRNGIAFVVHAPGRSESRAMLVTLWQGEEAGTNPEWVLWDVQGRTATFGWTRQRTIPTATFDRLRFDPIRLAYGSQVELLKAPSDLNPPPPAAADIWQRFLVPSPSPPVDAEEAFVLQLYGKTLLDRAGNRQRQALSIIQYITTTRFQTPALSLWTGLQANPNNGLIPVIFPPEARAVASLSVRAARRAVLASPDHPDGYYYLGLSYSDIGFTAPFDLVDVVSVVNLARARARVPDTPTQFRPGFDVAELGKNLAIAHARAAPPRLDLALDAQKLAVAYLRRDVEEREATLPAVPADARDVAEAQLEDRRRYLVRLDQDLQNRDTALKGNLTKYLVEMQPLTSPTDRAAVARRYGLVREAIGELRKAHEQFQKQLQDRPDRQLPAAELASALAVHAELIELLWYDGQVEEAARILDSVDSSPEVLRVMETPAVRAEYLRVRQRALGQLFRGAPGIPNSPYNADPAAHFRNLRRALSMIVGNFERATEVQIEEAKLVDQQLTEMRAKYFPTGKIPDPAELPDPTSLQVDLALRPALGAIAAARMFQVRQAQQFRTLSAMRAEGQLAIALTYLEWGDVPRAVHYLKQAEDAPGWTEPIRAQLMARDLLKAIERAGPIRGTGP